MGAVKCAVQGGNNCSASFFFFWFKFHFQRSQFTLQKNTKIPNLTMHTDPYVEGKAQRKDHSCVYLNQNGSNPIVKPSYQS